MQFREKLAEVAPGLHHREPVDPEPTQHRTGMMAPRVSALLLAAAALAACVGNL
jgi:hypothetical protein